MQANTAALLVRWREGDDAARDFLIERLQVELSQIAASRLRREHGSSLSSGDLINEAVVQLLDLEGHCVVDRAHFVALASRLMRNILVQHARRKATVKRDHVKVELCTRIDGEQRLDLVELDSAMMRLRVVDVGLSELVEMRYFGGMTIADIAIVTELSEPTIKRRWKVARAWLADALSHPLHHG